jgi:Fe-S cluster assembly scaffold protein SufB
MATKNAEAAAVAKDLETCLDEVDPEILEVYKKLGIPLRGAGGARRASRARRKVAVDAVFDSVSVVTTFKEELAKAGRDLLLDLRGDPRASRAGEEISRLGRAGAPTTSSRR